jgi:hypothetical protein
MNATPVPCGTSAVTAKRPAPGTAVVTDKGLPGQGTEEFFAGPDPSFTDLSFGCQKAERCRPPSTVM